MERGQPLGKRDDALVQISAVHVEGGLLARHRLDDGGVAVPDAGHVVVHVDVAAAIGVVDVRALAADDVERLAIEERRASPQRLVSARHK